MSDDPTQIHSLQVGTASTPDGTPGAWVDVVTQGEVQASPVQTKIPIDGQRDDGQHTAAQNGVKTAGLSFQTHMRVQGDQGVGGTPAPPTDLDLLFENFFGITAVHSDGREIQDATPTTTQLDLELSDDLSDGTSTPPNAFVFTTASDGLQAREAILVSGTTVDLDRALGSAPANGSNCHGMSSWVVDADNTEHDYTFFRAETTGRRYDFDGCALQLKITIPLQGLVTCDWTVLPTDWSRETKASPTFSSSGKGIGNGIAGNGQEFYIGATKVPLCGPTVINFNFVPEPRPYGEGTNGVYGHVWKLSGPPTIEFEMYLDTTHEDNFRSENTYDLAIQCGNPDDAATTYKCLYIRVPAAQGESVTEGNVNGLYTRKFKCNGTRHTTGNIHMHLGGGA